MGYWDDRQMYSTRYNAWPVAGTQEMAAIDVLSFYPESILVNVKLSSLLWLSDLPGHWKLCCDIEDHCPDAPDVWGLPSHNRAAQRGDVYWRPPLVPHRAAGQAAGEWPVASHRPASWREPGAELKVKSSSSPFSGDLAAVNHLKSSR